MTAPAPINICGSVPPPTPRLMIEPPADPLTLSNVPSPLPTTAESPKTNSWGTPAPVPRISEPAATLNNPLETRMMSVPRSGSPAVWTVKFRVVTPTTIPAGVVTRCPPTNKLSAPKRFNCETLSAKTPAPPPVPSALIKMSPGLLRSTSAPNPPANVPDPTRPFNTMELVALSESCPASPGNRGTAKSRALAASPRNGVAS